MDVAHPQWGKHLHAMISKLQTSSVDHDLKIVVFDNDDIEFVRLLRTMFPDTRLDISVGSATPGRPYTLDYFEGVVDSREAYLTRAEALASRLLHDPDLGACRVLPQYHVLLWGHKRGV